LRELMGDADLRELLDLNAIEETEEQLQCLVEGYKARNMDGVHDLLLRLGDLSCDELQKRSAVDDATEFVTKLVRARRVLEVSVAGQKHLIAVEDAGRYRDALGVPLPHGLPAALLEPVSDAGLDLVRRYARTHGPFTLREVAGRFGMEAPSAEAALRTLVLDGRVLEGGFRRGGAHREWCDAESLRLIRNKSLTRLRKEI
jgi:ATP-dependent Lhr-like helicase